MDTLDAATTYRYTTVFAPRQSGGYIGRLLVQGEPIEVCGPSLSETRWKLEYAARDHLTVCLLRNKLLPEPGSTLSELQGGNSAMLQSLPIHRLIIDYLDMTIDGQ